MTPQDSQEYSNNLAPLLQALEAAGIAEADIAGHLADLIRAKAETAQSVPKAAKKHYLDQTHLIDGEDAFIYRRADTKRQLWYLRMYDKRDKKNVVRSLGTTDKSLARAKAIEIWQEVSQKIRSNQKIVSITTKQLCERYIKEEQRNLSDVPKQGITPATLKNKIKHLTKWQGFIEELGLSATPVDRLDPAKLEGDVFGKWVLSRPQPRTYEGRPRSRDAVNGTISQVRRMYKFAVKRRLLGSSQVPDLEYLKVQDDGQHKRDILTRDEYQQLWRWMQDKWCRGRTLQRYDRQSKEWIACDADHPDAKWRKDESITDRELARRVCWEKMVGVMTNVGARPKEYQGLRCRDIVETDNPDPEIRNNCTTLVITAANSKTGKGRRIVAPIKKRIAAISDIYTQCGFEHHLDPNSDALFFVDPKDGKPWTQRKMRLLLNEVLIGSGLKTGKSTDKSLTLYFTRHQYATWRLMAGVDRGLVAKNMGTSLLQLEKTYGHIDTEISAAELIKGQGYQSRALDLLDTEVEVK